MEKTMKIDDPDAGPLSQEGKLPRTYHFKNGIAAILRWIKPEEYRPIFDMFTAAMKAGAGYTEDEYLTYDKFVNFQINDRYVIVVEEESTGKLLGYVCGGTHARIKGEMPTICDCSVVFDPRFRGLGIGNELTILFPALMKYLGYEWLMADTAIVNRPMRQLENKFGWITLGVYPMGMLMAGVGWCDYVFSIKDLNTIPTFTDLVRKSHERAAAAKNVSSKI